MRQIFYILFLVTLISSCIDIIPSQSKKLTKDFYLKWSWEKREQKLFLSDDISTGGLCPVLETVYEIAYNDDFILAKRYENKKEVINNRLLRPFEGGIEPDKVYPLKVPSDSVYLSNKDLVFNKQDKFYFLSSKDYETRTIPDSLFPNKNKTYYYIIDIREYDYNGWFERNILLQKQKYAGFKVYEFESEESFMNERKELQVPDNLEFQKCL